MRSWRGFLELCEGLETGCVSKYGLTFEGEPFYEYRIYLNVPEFNRTSEELNMLKRIKRTSCFFVALALLFCSPALGEIPGLDTRAPSLIESLKLEKPLNFCGEPVPM